MNDREIAQPKDGSPEFEKRLSQAMSRVDPPPGFADRVMNRAAWPGRMGRWGVPMRAWAIAAMVLLAVSIWLANGIRVRRERERVARIQSQFETAVRITNRALDQARSQLDRSGLGLRDQPALQDIQEK